MCIWNFIQNTSRFFEVKRFLVAVILFLIIPIIGLSQNQINPDQISGSTQNGLEILDSKTLISEGIEYMQTADYNTARLYFNMAVTHSIEEDSSQNQILALNNIGNIFYYLNEPDSALMYYYQSLDIAEESKSLSLQNTIQNNIGIIYASTDHYEEAKMAMEKALSISILLNDTNSIVLNLINLGSQNVLLENISDARKNLTKAKNMLDESQSTEGLFAIYINLGNIHMADSNYEKALESFKLGKDLVDGNHALNMIQISNNLGMCYSKLNLLDSALIHLELAYKMALESNYLNGATASLLWQSEVYEKQQDSLKAMNALNEVVNLKDSIILLEKENWIAQSQAKYQFELKQREFNLQTENAKRQTFFLRVLLTASVVILLLLIVILRMRIKTSKLREAQHLAEEIISKEKLKKAKSKNKELKETIETVNYELVSKTLLLDNKNQILDSIGKVVDEAEASNLEVNNTHVSQLKRHLLRDNSIDQNWEEFEIYFERVHTNFFKNIHTQYPKLTTNDLRLTAFLLLQLNSKEISQILNITPDSVRKRKQRLRQKLEIDKSEDLLNHLYQFT